MGPPLRPFYGCSRVDREYDLLKKLGEGTFGEVHKGKHKASGRVVALKRLFLHDELEGFPITALREIKILKNLDHSNVIPLVDMAVQRGDPAKRKRAQMYMVTPYMEHDLAGLLDNSALRLDESHIKQYMMQLLEGVNYLHQQKYLHRDIKAANILIDNRGNLRIADFGLARRYFDPAPTVDGAGPRPETRYTSMVITRWYRPPELLLGESHYTTAVDMWGVGCVFGEFFRRKPIFQGKSDADQGVIIFKTLGSPSEETMPGFDQLPNTNSIDFGKYPRQLEKIFADLSRQALSLLSGLLDLNPEKRLSALGALAHDYFKSGIPPARKEDLPIYADSHELDVRNSRSQPAPHAPDAMHGRNPMGDRAPGRGYNGYDGYRDRGPPAHKRQRTPEPPYLRKRRQERGVPEPPYRRREMDRRGPPEPPYRRQNQHQHHHQPEPPYRRRSRSPPPPPPPGRGPPEPPYRRRSRSPPPPPPVSRPPRRDDGHKPYDMDALDY